MTTLDRNNLIRRHRARERIKHEARRHRALADAIPSLHEVNDRADRIVWRVVVAIGVTAAAAIWVVGWLP